jgi:ribulose-5-phosphate 4-epimerase/fuculose-1-phosphate aldolase
MDVPVADRALLRDVVISNRILAREGVLDAFGHVSVRHPEEPGHYVIARSLGPAYVTEDDLQRFTLTGLQVGGDTRKPYAERAIHGAIYAARQDVLAICHNHSPSIIPFGVTRTRLRPLFHMAALLGSEIPTWDMRDDFGDSDLLVRTEEQGASLARTLSSRRVALMRGHGGVVVGRTLREVAMASVYMEHNARLQLQAMSLGEVSYLSAGEVEQASQMLLEPLVMERAWHAWRERAGVAD